MVQSRVTVRVVDTGGARDFQFLDIFKLNVLDQGYLLGSGSRYDPVTVRVGDQLVWVTLEGRVPLPTSYAPSSEDILGIKG